MRPLLVLAELHNPGVDPRVGRERQRAGVAGGALPRAPVRADGRGVAGAARRARRRRRSAGAARHHPLLRAARPAQCKPYKLPWTSNTGTAAGKTAAVVEAIWRSGAIYIMCLPILHLEHLPVALVTLCPVGSTRADPLGANVI